MDDNMIDNDQLNREEEGATIIEYAILAALIVVICVGVILVVGQKVSQQFSGIATSL